MDKFISEAAKAHNEYRTKHCAQPLKTSRVLSKEAQKWAEKLASTGRFEHSDNKVNGETLGENIAMKWTSGSADFTGQQVSDQWYSEEPKYDYSGSNNGAGAGHFSQIVWKGSKEVGFGKAKAKDGKYIVVANYLPAGNFIGRFKENVSPPQGSRSGGGSGSPARQTFPSNGRGQERRDFPRDTSQSAGSTVTTETTVETDPSGRTKTIVKETRIEPDGRKVTSEKITYSSTSGGADGGFNDRQFQRKFDKLDIDPKTRSKSPKQQQSMSKFIEDCVKEHNHLRKKHRVSGLKHNADMSKMAQKWADHLASTNVLQHSEDSFQGEKLGENVATKWSSSGDDYTGEQVVQQWYSEISKHKFGEEPRTLSSGHFTQVVWKGSREIGIGKSSGQAGRVFVVANYKPAGNFVGHFSENVLPPK